MAEGNGVLVVAEQHGGTLAPVTDELMGLGRKVADQLGQPLHAVVIGSGVQDLGQELVQLGADKVTVIDAPVFQNYQNATYTAAIEKLVRQTGAPMLLLFAASFQGRDLAPRVAFRLDAGIGTNVLDVNVQGPGQPVQMVRAAYGGNAQQLLEIKTTPQIATIWPKSQDAAQRDPSRTGEVVTFDPGVDESAAVAKVVEQRKEVAGGAKLEDAEIVISGGRGLGGPEPFKQLEELAQVMGGAVGASRAAVDAGWIPPAHQVGLTGVAVSPKLYIAIAISGASQHMAGIGGAKTIVTINKDPEAALFARSRYGVVTDFKQFMPAFIEKVRELVGR
ncbi:MAG TPA: electron transfer flavoprotein subunit alpha/FixB family protein [Dehalococcoidia bacterium]|nr:electron transfer flavoprotein subunit alpha/FixB family protein [Dehalococcoidia bacterium]